MKYRSRISVLILIFIFVVSFFPLLDGKDLLAKSIALGIGYTFTMLMSLLIFITISYTILDGTLVIRMCGFKATTINIAAIKSIKRSYNPLSSPAASLKRLEITFYYQGRIESALISPKRETEFLEKLKEINPNIKIIVEHKHNIFRFWDI